MAEPIPRFLILTAGSLPELAEKANALNPAYSPVGRPFDAASAGDPIAWAFELRQYSGNGVMGSGAPAGPRRV
jgi:hypothetical protein